MEVTTEEAEKRTRNRKKVSENEVVKEVGFVLWNIQKVMLVTGYSKPSIYRKAANNSFPRPLKTGNRASRWKSNEVLDWVDGLKRACLPTSDQGIHGGN